MLRRSMVGVILACCACDPDDRSMPGSSTGSGWELARPGDVGVTRIDLRFTRPASRCDPRGNCEGEGAAVEFTDVHGARATREVIDVRLACQ